MPMAAKLPPETQSPDLPPLDRSRPSVPPSPGGHFIYLRLLSSYHCPTQPCSPRTRRLFPEFPTQDDPPPLPPLASPSDQGTPILLGPSPSVLATHGPLYPHLVTTLTRPKKCHPWKSSWSPWLPVTAATAPLLSRPPGSHTLELPLLSQDPAALPHCDQPHAPLPQLWRQEDRLAYS